jgi:hypothetical protein
MLSYSVQTLQWCQELQSYWTFSVKFQVFCWQLSVQNIEWIQLVIKATTLLTSKLKKLKFFIVQLSDTKNGM